MDTVFEFVTEILDDERTEYTAEELHQLRVKLGRGVGDTHKLVVELESWGLTLRERPKAKRVRTLGNSSDNDRWYGPGSSPTHGGSGWDNIFGVLK